MNERNAQASFEWHSSATARPLRKSPALPPRQHSVLTMLGQASLGLCSGTDLSAHRQVVHSNCGSSRTTARPLLAQASLEFMLTAVLVLILLGISAGIYSTSMAEASALKSSLEANRICIMSSSVLSSLASLRGNANYTFDLPPKINGENYTIYIVSEKQMVKVDFAGRAGVGCGLPTMNITNGTSTAFFMKRNASVQWQNKVLTIVP